MSDSNCYLTAEDYQIHNPLDVRGIRNKTKITYKLLYINRL